MASLFHQTCVTLGGYGCAAQQLEHSNREANKLTPVSQQPQPAGYAGLLAFSLLAFTEQQLIGLIYV